MTGMVKKYIAYLGIENPATMAEVRVEICGLRNAVKMAEELASRLEQSLAIADMKRTEMIHEQQQQQQQQKSEAEKDPPEGEKADQE